MHAQVCSGPGGGEKQWHMPWQVCKSQRKSSRSHCLLSRHGPMDETFLPGLPSSTFTHLVVFSGMVLNVKILVTCILITPPLPLSRSISLFLLLFLPNFNSYFFPQTHQVQFVLVNYYCKWVMAWSVLTYLGSHS